MSDIILNTVETLDPKGLPAESYWSYEVRRDGENLIFSFDTYPLNRKLLHHTSKDYYPLAKLNISARDEVIIAPGQWLHGLVNGGWSYLSDADNR